MSAVTLLTLTFVLLVSSILMVQARDDNRSKLRGPTREREGGIMMKQLGRRIYVLFIASLAIAISPPAFAGGLYAYPLKGQNAQQQAADRQSCHDWAIAQSGFNPSTIPQTPHGAAGAFEGMLVGLLAGGIVAATGGGGAAVAIGAGGGGLIGGIFGKDKQAKINAEYDAYLRAAQTCMTAKGYQVSI